MLALFKSPVDPNNPANIEPLLLSQLDPASPRMVDRDFRLVELRTGTEGRGANQAESPSPRLVRSDCSNRWGGVIELFSCNPIGYLGD
jgi:hypothetical protein